MSLPGIDCNKVVTFLGESRVVTIDRSLSFGQIDKALNNIDNSKELYLTTFSDSPASLYGDNSIGKAIGEVTSALFSIPDIVPEQEDPLIKKRKKKEKYRPKR